MEIVAVILVAAFAISGSAFAKEKYRGDNSYRRDGLQQQANPVIGWDDNARQPKKIYNWPDQRYYGQHGMMLD